MNVMGIGISAQVSIDIPYGSNNATVEMCIRDSLEPICVETDVKKGNFEYEASVIIPVRNRARTCLLYTSNSCGILSPYFSFTKA